MPAAGFVRVGPLFNLPAVVSELGLEPGPLFARMDFDTAEFNDPANTIPFIPASNLLACCARETGCEHLGLKLGERADPSALGVVGFMLRAAPTLGDALTDLVHNLDLQDGGASLYLDTDAHNASLQYVIDLPGVDALATELVYDLSITVASIILQALCGPDWKPSRIYLARRTPQNTRYYRTHFQAPVTFEAERSAVVFPILWLEHRSERADPLLHRHLQKEANQLRGLNAGNTLEDLPKILNEAILAGQCSVSSIARKLGLHQRTLNRRLQASGTSYRQELNQARFEIARQLLARSSQAIAQIAFLLNYSDVSSFNRAFKSWAGVTPAKWRKQIASRDHPESPDNE